MIECEKEIGAINLLMIECEKEIGAINLLMIECEQEIGAINLLMIEGSPKGPPKDDDCLRLASSQMIGPYGDIQVSPHSRVF
jgi:hypothetical protein